jgi:chromosome segregation ATPase
MDSNLERHLKQLAAEMQSVKTKAQADAVALIDQYIEKNKALEQQLLAANCNVDLMKKRIDHLDQNRNKSKAETEELKEELKSARSLLDLNSQELHDVTGRLQELSKANEHKEEQLNTYVSQTKELGKQLETAKNEKKNLEEKLASTNDQLLSTLDAANSEKKRLEEKMEEAHAKLVSLADVYQQQQRTVTKLEQMIEDYEQDAHDKLKAATTRCLDAESQLELTKSANEKLKKKIEKLKELYYGEISKCNRAAEAYRASKKTTSNH